VWILIGVLCLHQYGFADASSSAITQRLQACEVEMGMLKNSISTQEQAREALEKEVSGLLRATRDSLAESRETSSSRQKTFDGTLEKLTQDLKSLKSHSNDLSQTVNDLAKTIQGIKESEHQHDHAIKELEQAMRALTLAMGGKSPAKSTNGQKTATYTVKSGDSLEKIARAHGMTLSEIKEMNSLKTTTLKPGQELTVRQP
jgi:LysM repeat protein